MLAHLPHDFVLGVDEANDHGKVGLEGFLILGGRKRERRRFQIDNDGDKARVLFAGKLQRTGAIRERVRHRPAVERGKRGGLPRIDRRATGIAHGEVPFPRRHRQTRPLHLDLDLAERAVVGRSSSACIRSGSSCADRFPRGRTLFAGCWCCRRSGRRCPGQARRDPCGGPGEARLRCSSSAFVSGSLPEVSRLGRTHTT